MIAASHGVGGFVPLAPCMFTGTASAALLPSAAAAEYGRAGAIS
jgi:hypothetical protein